MAKGRVSSERAPGSFTIIPLLIFIIVTLVGWFFATQMLAKDLGYQQELGSPLFIFKGYPCYLPWKVLVWNYWFHSYAVPQFNHAMLYVFGSVGLAVVSVILYVVWLSRRTAVATTYGSAKWGSLKRMEAAGLLSDTGVVLGVADNGKYVIHDGPENVSSTAPPRSGKGVGQIIPTLLIWKHSVVVNDVKKELWEATSGFRKKFSNVIYFNPCSVESAHFNPLLEVRLGLNQVKDVQNIADMIVNPDGNGKPDHWEKTGHDFLVGCILHILYAENNKSLNGLVEFISNPERSIIDTLQLMLHHEYADSVAQNVIRSSARAMLNKAPNELSGVVSTALSFLGLYKDPIIAKNISTSDFRIQDLMQADNPVSLYLVIPPSDISRVRRLLRLMWSQIGRRLTEELGPNENKHRLLLLMDEFAALGRIEFFETALAYTPGYGIKSFIITQSRNQLDAVYGVNNSILDACHVRAVYTPNDEKSADMISSMTGITTGVHQQKTYTGHRLAPWLAHIMIADQEVSRPLLTTGEVLTFPKDEAIVFVAGESPFRINKLKYYQDNFFKKRILPAPGLSGFKYYPYRPKQRPNQWKEFINNGVIDDSYAGFLNNSVFESSSFDIDHHFDNPEYEHTFDFDIEDEQTDIEVKNSVSELDPKRVTFALDENKKHHHEKNKDNDIDFSI